MRGKEIGKSKRGGSGSSLPPVRFTAAADEDGAGVAVGVVLTYVIGNVNPRLCFAVAA